MQTILFEQECDRDAKIMFVETDATKLSNESFAEDLIITFHK